MPHINYFRPQSVFVINIILSRQGESYWNLCRSMHSNDVWWQIRQDDGITSHYTASVKSSYGTVLFWSFRATRRITKQLPVYVPLWLQWHAHTVIDRVVMSLAGHVCEVWLKLDPMNSVVPFSSPYHDPNLVSGSPLLGPIATPCYLWND